MSRYSATATYVCRRRSLRRLPVNNDAKAKLWGIYCARNERASSMYIVYV